MRVPSLSRLLFVFSLLACLLTASHATASGDESEFLTLGQVGSGSLLIRTDEAGKYFPAPVVAADVSITISGSVARTVVTQRFENPSDIWIEAVYAFPLPEDAAVDTLKLQIGDRFIEGKIKKREEARKIFQAAVAEGKKASLVEQQRPNLFTNEVANIGPGETVVVQIEYQETVRINEGAFHLRFPMVVGPRYNPPARIAQAEVEGSTIHVLADPVPDRNKLPQTYAHPDSGHVNPLRLAVELAAGFPVAAVETPFHKTIIDNETKGVIRLKLAEDSVPANRDFELIWKAEPGTEPYTGLFEEQSGKEHFLLLNLVPPSTQPTHAVPRELVLVIDVSGSMAGASIRQARSAALAALDRLTPQDSINVITFSSTTNALFPAARPASTTSIAQARHFVGRLQANGGTEMLPALLRALEASKAATSEAKQRLRQVVFITDGSVGNEEELFRAIDLKLGTSRLFTVGIGSAPNSFFMNRAARLGRGTFTHIGAPSQVASRMKALFQKLESPLLTGIEVVWPAGAAPDQWPDTVPDLYYGEPISIAAKAAQLSGKLAISGILDGQPWKTIVKLGKAKKAEGVAAVWARSKIASLEEARYRGADAARIAEQITELALRHHLVSPHTSLVAVDVTPSRREDEAIQRRDVPLMLPEGWEWNAVFSESVKARPIHLRREAQAGPTLKLAAASAPPLPQGATHGTLLIWAGAGLMILGLCLILLNTVRTRRFS